MHDGLPYVLAGYAVTAAALGTYVAVLHSRLRRARARVESVRAHRRRQPR